MKSFLPLVSFILGLALEGASGRPLVSNDELATATIAEDDAPPPSSTSVRPVVSETPWTPGGAAPGGIIHWFSFSTPNVGKMSYELQNYNASSSNSPGQEKTPESIYRQHMASDSSMLGQGAYYAESNSDNGRGRYGKVQTGWLPMILRPWSLIIFLVVYIGIFVTLIGLYVRSKRDQGLSTERESRHYLWTYGPTAVFILLAAFWRHLDHHIKSLMPWVELASGPKHAKLTVLLDYISPFQPVAFWYACKNRHWLVIITAVAFAILKVATVFATGLFILQAAELETENRNFMQYADEFSAAGFNISNIDSRASYTVYGSSSLNLSYPAGTNLGHAFQSFSNLGNVSLVDIASISIPVDVFSAKLDCLPASLNWTNDRNIRLEITPLSQFYNTTAFAPGCTLKNLRLDAPSWLGNTTEQGYDGRVQNATCEEIEDPAKAARLFVAMTYSTRANYTNTLRNYTVFSCEASYSIQRSRVTIAGNVPNDYTRVTKIQPIGDPFTLPEFTSKDLTEGILKTLQESATQLTSSGWDRAFDPYFSSMWTLRKDVNYTDFMEPELLQTTSSELYSALAAQIAKSSLTRTPETITMVDATVARYQQRLILRPVSVIVMELLVFILIVITICILIMVPRQGVAPRDPGTIGALATILSRSKNLEQSLSGTSNLSEKDLEAWLHRYRFYTTVEDGASGRSFKVELVDIFPQSGHKRRYSDEVERFNADKPRASWWKPIGLQWWVISPLVIFPIAIIVVLEVLYRISERNNGLAVIPVDGYIHYTWVYVPALTMVLLVTTFNMVDYATRSIAPYQAMRLESATASRGILYNPAGKLTLPALWYAIKERHITVIATTFAVLIAPVLTISVSGLYFSRLVSHVSTLSVEQATWFNSSQLEYSVNTTDNIISNLIISGNLSYPTWTYEDLAFAELVLPNNTVEEAADAVTLEIPAIRPLLNCTIVPRDRYLELQLGQSGVEDEGSESGEVDLTGTPVWVNISMPGDCGNFGTIDGDETWLGELLQHPETGYFGSLLQLSGESGDGSGCPDFAVFYGRMDGNKIDNVTTLLCNGWTQSLNVKSTFLLPNFTVDASSPPPERLGSTAKWFSNQLIYPGYTFSTLNANSGAVDILDDFLTAVVYGKGGIPLDELIIPERLVEGVGRLYGITATQAVSQDARIPAGAINNGQTILISGTSRTRPQAKLVQSEPSTRLLQVLLAFIMVMTIVVYFGVKARELLPRESNSIATIGGYLAGSDVLRLVPEGAEWKSDGRGNGDWFKGYMFGFGWWEDGERQGKKRYGVGIGKSG
ncbi:hypothetical protein ABW19_dt0200430 [Dactylella cylindrospora]|nr:hypothetical protein ABW19_dt0200430 [Dactylella cylindrospora]